MQISSHYNASLPLYLLGLYQLLHCKKYKALPIQFFSKLYQVDSLPLVVTGYPSRPVNS